MGEGAQRRTHQKYDALLAYRKNSALLADFLEPLMQDG